MKDPFNSTGTLERGVFKPFGDEAAEPKPAKGPFDSFSKPVRAALTRAGIKTLADLQGKTQADLEALDGIGEATAKELLELKE